MATLKVGKKIMKALQVLLILFPILAFGQASSGNLALPTNTSVSEWKFPSTETLHQYLRISYFGEFTGSSIKKLDDNQVNPEGQRTRDPVSMWHSFNVLGRFYNKTSLYMSPRFYTVFGDRNELKNNQDPHVVVMDDWQFGFSQNWIKDDKFSWDTRFSHRAPMSQASRNESIDSQIEVLQVVTWKPIAPIFILSQTNLRYYKYEPQVKEERYRINQLTAFNWIFNDKWRLQLFNEFDLQHRNPKEGSQKKDWNYFKKYKNNPAVGIGYNPFTRLTLMPYIKALNDTDIRNETVVFGLWAFASVF
ncbi:MAG: hypothetical protein AB7I27_12675 [Bacteriovoracaceae bacterium]